MHGARRRRAGSIGFDLRRFLGAWLRAPPWSIPLLALVVGLAGVYQYEQEQRIAELADLDAAVLSDDLPLTAYLGPRLQRLPGRTAAATPQRAQ